MNRDSSNRHGFVGLMVTMALGMALGAAALVVSKEIKEKGVNGGGSTSVSKTDARQNQLQVAASTYQQAKQAYDRALSTQSPDLAIRRDALLRAKARYEKAILLTTPGVTIPGTASNAKSNTAVESKTQTDKKTSQASAHTSPFDEGTNVTIGKAAAVPFSDSSSTVAKPSVSANVPSNISEPTTSEGSANLEYVKVKSGDSLSDICKKFYGDSGMWTHILKYQIPSIAANPNLIFPGQLIALPRGLTTPAKPTTSPNTGVATALPIAPAGDESWQETFQRDFLISDHTFTDTNTMTVAQIQAFLEKKGSCLAQPYRGSSPAQMIYDAAKKIGINPQVILTRLQCEQSLISKKSATEKELDWALGVGAYDGGNWNQNFKGFDKQIEGAAATYKRHYLDAKAKLDRGESLTMKIDGTTIDVKNAATYSFYQYCPHVAGNKLFFDVWRCYKNSF
ncbi:MAG: LysM peptidoglycan-binding domain-containing protein [Candidatus Riflebacteria bacterium]|nr:LysM peptidoglycan-binding domain-containing protein [Candidatus Riflebacteria bacterium]